MEMIDTIGNTALLDLTPFIKKSTAWVKNHCADSNLLEKAGFSSSSVPSLSIRPDVSIFAKCEHLNPTGSIKDRIVVYMIQQAEKKGYLKSVDTLIESTSGNTGAAVAMMAAIKGYKALLVIPDRVSQEKQATLRALGAEVRVMPGDAKINSQDHYIKTARRLAETTPNSFYLNQYHSVHNRAAHYHTTGPEIWSQMQGNIDVFISVAGSGGTISGVGCYLKEKNPNIKIIAVDPVSSVYYHYFKYGTLPKSNIQASQVEGAGSDHITQSMDFSVIDDIVQFRDENAFYTTKWLAKRAGILVGASSGANLFAALQIAQKAKRPMRIVTIFPDSGMKYLSKFHQDDWMRAQSFCS